MTLTFADFASICQSGLKAPDVTYVRKHQQTSVDKNKNKKIKIDTKEGNMIFRIYIPGEPQGKARPRHTRDGRVYTPKETGKYESWVRECFRKRYPDYRPDSKVPLSITIESYFGMPKSASKKRKQLMLDRVVYPAKKPDADNIAKIVLDGLNGVAYMDDAQVCSLRVHKFYAEKPMVVVTIWECDHESR